MCVNTKQIIEYWKKSIGLGKSYLETLGANELENIMETQHTDLEYLQMDLNDIKETMDQIKDHINTIETILAEKYKDEEESE